jgi:hypothetical protein
MLFVFVVIVLAGADAVVLREVHVGQILTLAFFRGILRAIAHNQLLLVSKRGIRPILKLA